MHLLNPGSPVWKMHILKQKKDLGIAGLGQSIYLSPYFWNHGCTIYHKTGSRILANPFRGLYLGFKIQGSPLPLQPQSHTLFPVLHPLSSPPSDPRPQVSTEPGGLGGQTKKKEEANLNKILTNRGLCHQSKHANILLPNRLLFLNFYLVDLIHKAALLGKILAGSS